MSDFAAVKDRVNLRQLIPQETGLKLGSSHLEKCPFCGETTCFSIKKDGRSWKCFKCDLSGDVFDFIGQHRGVEKGEALEYAAGLVGIELERKESKKRVRYSKVEKIWEAAADYYHQHLINDEKKLAYQIETRGHSLEVLKKMRVGLSRWGLYDKLKQFKFDDEDILKSGLCKQKEKDGRTVITDYFKDGTYIYPHMSAGKIRHFTMKNPDEPKNNYQLKKEHRHDAWYFYNQDSMEKYDDVILIEGENDILTQLDIGMHNVIGMNGQISAEQLQRLNSLMRSTTTRNRTLYLWMDNDLPKQRKSDGKWVRAGHDYVRKLHKELRNIEIQVLVSTDGEDPDSYVRKLGGDVRSKREHVKMLMDNALDYISWEILQAGTEIEAAYNHLREHSIYEAISREPELKQQIYIDRLEKIGFKRESIAEEIRQNSDLLRQISIYFEQIGAKKDADPNIVADIIYRHFSGCGRFFYDCTNKVYLLYNQHIFEVGDNLPFNALLNRKTKLLYTEQPGRSVWKSLQIQGYNNGLQIDMASWIYTNRKTDTVFINLNSKNNSILRIAPGEVKEVENGINQDAVLLKSSSDIEPFTYLPHVTIREGMQRLKELVFDNLSVEIAQRYLVLTWMITGFLPDYTSNKMLLKFAGATASGKSSGAELGSAVYFGKSMVGDITAAAAYSESAMSPLLVIDNLESDDITKGMLKFLLLAATGGNKKKRSGGSDSGTVEEKPKSLILVTAIEPFQKAELINRTVELTFKDSFHAKNFVKDECFRAIEKDRDIILSSIIKFLSKDILPNLSDRRKYLEVLRTQFPGHSKSRLDEYFSLLMLILEKMLPHIPYLAPDDPDAVYESGANQVWTSWINYQNAAARTVESGSNHILRLLDSMGRDYLHQMKISQLPFDEATDKREHLDPEVGLKIIQRKPEQRVDEDTGEPYTAFTMEFEATAAELLDAFDVIAKRKGIKNEYKSSAVLGKRITNDINTLKKAGWELIQSENEKIRPHFKKIKGYRYFKFVNTRVQ
jgi:DNA primase